MFALPNPDYESHRKYQGFLDLVNDEVRQAALNKFLKGFQEHYRRHLTSPELQYDVRIGEGDDLLRALQQDGCALGRIGADEKAKLIELAEPFAKAIHAHMDQLPKPKFKDGQRQFDPVEHAHIFKAADEALESANVYAAGSAYAGKAIKLKTLAVQVNTARATAATYGDLDGQGVPKPRTRYLHVDSALWPPLKVLIYLNPVGPDTGPFRYVVGSHRLATEFELMVRKTNDKCGIHQEYFMALPPPFRMYTEFGDAMDAKSDQATALISNERAFCDGVSDMVLFDFNGVHRGGFVREGHRYILQCCFEGRD